MNFIKRAGYQAVFLGSLFYNGLGFAQETSEETSGFSQPDAKETTANRETECPNCPSQGTAPAASTKPASTSVNKRTLGSDPVCSTVYPNFRCMNKTEARISGYEMHPAKDYTTSLEEACPGKLICAGHKVQSIKIPLASAVSVVDEFNVFKSLFDSDACRQEYITAVELHTAQKEHCSKVGELEEKISKATAKKKEAVPQTLLDAINQSAAALPSSDNELSNLTNELNAERDACSANIEQFKEYIAKLKEYGCGHRVVTIEVPKETVKEVTVEKIVEQGGHFTFAPFMAYAFSNDAENQGRLGVSAGYQTGRWTPGLRAAAIFQSADVDTDTDRSGIQTVNLPGDVQKTTADVTKTTTETKDFVAVGPEVTYSRGRFDLGAGVDALIGQRNTRKDYTGSMRLTKDGQQLDGKKTIGDSTTNTETWYGANLHGGLNVRTLRNLRLGVEGGYSTRSKSAQGIFEIRYKF